MIIKSRAIELQYPQTLDGMAKSWEPASAEFAPPEGAVNVNVTTTIINRKLCLVITWVELSAAERAAIAQNTAQGRIVAPFGGPR